MLCHPFTISTYNWLFWSCLLFRDSLELLRAYAAISPTAWATYFHHRHKCSQGQSQPDQRDLTDQLRGLKCWHVGRCTNILPKARATTALISLEILQAQIDLSKSWKHSGVATPPRQTCLVKKTVSFLLWWLLPPSHSTDMSLGEEEKPVFVRIWHCGLQLKLTHLKGKSQP